MISKINAIELLLVEMNCLEGQLQFLVPMSMFFFCRKPVLMCDHQQGMRQLTILMSTAVVFSNVMAMTLSHWKLPTSVG